MNWADGVADDFGVTYNKMWSTSGLPHTRESHTFAENWSFERNGIKSGKRFNMGDGTFMMQPGDPAGGRCGSAAGCLSVLESPLVERQLF